MGAVTVSTTIPTSQKMVQMCGGVAGAKGATIKVILLTLPASYDAGGSTIDFSTPFPNRVFWVLPMTATAKDATTGFTQIGIVPGTAKTDKIGGFSSTDWKLVSSVGAAEASGSLADHVTYVVACGY